MTMSSEKKCRPIESEHLFPNSWPAAAVLPLILAMQWA
jgi:hypothetical protein